MDRLLRTACWMAFVLSLGFLAVLVCSPLEERGIGLSLLASADKHRPTATHSWTAVQVVDPDTMPVPRP